MANFQKKIHKFQSRGGMDWNHPVDLIPEGGFAYGRNIRVLQDGEIVTRPGISFFYFFPGASYVHSMSRLNNFSTNLNISYVYIIGADQHLWSGQNPADFNNSSINPLQMPFANLSGNPLTMVDAATESGSAGWKYIGDSNGMLKVGYYPGETSSGNQAHAVTMGTLPPAWFPAISTATGLLNGSYQWATVFRNIYTGAQSNPSAATRSTLASPLITLSNQSATFTLPTTPIDPQTGAPDTHIVVDVYRFGGTILRWALVGSGASGSSFTDNQPDSAMLTDAAPSQITDPNTGVTRFNLFKPFPVPTKVLIGSSNGTIVQDSGTGIWTFAPGGGDTFPLGLLQGSVITIGGQAWHVYQVRSPTSIEITEDVTGSLVSGNSYTWSIPAGQLIAGTPCPHIWGPYGTGVQGSVIFGCGAPNAAGTLFWTNGNDPDSTDLANSLVVTSPSEPLKGGCVYNGLAFCWSTERQFQIFPSLSVPGQFYVQEVPGGKGLLMEWSLTVQTNSIADQSISWVGKDGIYNYTPSNGTQSLTDATLYPFFPHDNVPGLNIGAIFPWLATEPVFAPDFNQQGNPIPFLSKYHRLCWIDGELFYDFPSQSAGNYETLVFDSKNAGGWVSYDLYNSSTTNPKSRMTEIAANNMKLALGGSIYDYGTMVGTHTDDNGAAISSRMITAADDCGDRRGLKLYGDVWIDVDPGSSLTVAVLTALNTVNSATSPTFTNPGRVGLPIDLSTNGLGVLSDTIALVLDWSTGANVTRLFQWQFSYVPKPEYQGLRALDKTDDGWVGAKQLRGFVIEVNTSNQARRVNVLVDGALASNPVDGSNVFVINSFTNTQNEIAVGINPFVGQEFQIAIDPSDTAIHWEVFSIRWVWEKWADLAQERSAVLNFGADQVKYIEGFVLPLDTNGSALTFTAVFDANASVSSYTLPAVTTAAGSKTPVPFAFNPPVIAHNMQLVPSTFCRAWWEEIVPHTELWPELDRQESLFLNFGASQVKYIEGFVLPVDTNGATVTFTAAFDPGTGSSPASYALPPVTTPAGIKTPIAFAFDPPVIVHNMQLTPSAPCRSWYGDIIPHFELWPELDTEYSPWLMPASTAKPAYVRGFSMPIDTGGVPVAFNLRLDNNTVISLGTFTTVAGIKTTENFVVPAPFVSHEVRIEPQGAVRCWYPGTQVGGGGGIVWDAEQYPELSTEDTPIVNCGYGRAKFMQGVVIPLDTGGASASLQFVNVDTGLVGYATPAFSTTGKQAVAFSWPPFIAHLIQIIPLQACRIFIDEAVWIFEPTPEQALYWTTPPMTHGMTGWLHQRLSWIAYLSTQNVTFTRNFSDGTSETYTLPATGGLFSKLFLPLTPKKSLWYQYSMTCPAVFKVFVNDLEIHTKSWGSDGAYSIVKPVGSLSVLKGADI